MNTENHRNNQNFESACEFIIKLGKAAHGYGSTAGRLENYLTRMTEAIGYRGAFRVSSTEMISAFQEDENQPPQKLTELMARQTSVLIQRESTLNPPVCHLYNTTYGVNENV